MHVPWVRYASSLQNSSAEKMKPSITVLLCRYFLKCFDRRQTCWADRVGSLPSRSAGFAVSALIQPVCPHLKCQSLRNSDFVKFPAVYYFFFLSYMTVNVELTRATIPMVHYFSLDKSINIATSQEEKQFQFENKVSPRTDGVLGQLGTDGGGKTVPPKISKRKQARDKR